MRAVPVALILLASAHQLALGAGAGVTRQQVSVVIKGIIERNPGSPMTWDGHQWVAPPAPCTGSLSLQISVEGVPIVTANTSIVRSLERGKITVYQCAGSEMFYEVGSPDGALYANPKATEPGSEAPVFAVPNPANAGMGFEAALTSLTHKDAGIRLRAARALGHWGKAEAIAPLSQALSDQDASVRAAAACSLGNLGDGDAQQSLTSAAKRESDPVVTAALAWAIWKTDVAPHIRNLIALLKSDDASARVRAANRLGFILHPAVVPALQEALKDPDQAVRQAVGGALARHPAAGA